MSKRITTDKRAEAARINGAKSRGPKTPEGKAISSQNSCKHGGYARCALLLANEEASIFDSFRDAFIAKFQPIDPIETSLVDEMVFARWRMRRYWFAQDATIDIEMDRQIPLIEQEFDWISEPARLSRAISTLVDDSGSLDFLHRVEARCNRQFHRAFKDLIHLQSLRQPPVSSSQTPEIKNGVTNPSATQPSLGQQITPAPTAHFIQPVAPRPLLRKAPLTAAFFTLLLFLFSALALAGLQKTSPVGHPSASTTPSAYNRRIPMKERIRSTTILCVRRHGKVVMAGDGQVTLGQEVLKASANKLRRLYKEKILAGFAGSTADAFSLFARFEAKLEQHNGNLPRAAVELAKDWRTDKVLRHLEALLLVADPQNTYLVSGNGDVIEPDEAVAAIGSGGPFAKAAATALIENTELDARDIAEKAMKIAGEICIYTNVNVRYEELG